MLTSHPLSNGTRRSLIAVIFLALSISIVATSQLEQSGSSNLAAGIAQVKAGDFFGALFTLNDAVRQLSGSELARAHAYRATAYKALDQPERAEAAARQAIAADPSINVDPAEFGPITTALFADARRRPEAVTERKEAPAPIPASRAVEATAVLPAVIYVYLPQALRASGKRGKVECDGRHIADLANNRFVIVNATPGRHVIKFAGHALEASVAAGEEHYFRGGISDFGGMFPHFDLKVRTVGEAAAEIKGKNVAPNDPRRTYSTECSGPTIKRK